MSKRRIVLVVDEDTETIAGRQVVWQQRMATVETVEDVPEPDRVQDFRVLIETPPSWDPRTRGQVRFCLDHLGKTVTVTEVTT